ncbi:G-beta repeat protein, putative [Plasmodium gallinaceum]|uniref:G-beta repeat protein, putative n=1 Tax=Plasmodium gallinaceum TaxID=5849 RepID=A0A1J1GV52_PLAGA|nr:G-beta repeat protein, putative [Plasmodium gallinaceum]CRG95176.1 G-beta repeat protein, putative [Plasmodium gallinaceum]
MNIQNKPQIIEHINYSVDNTIYDVKWIDEKSKIVAVGELLDKKGYINIYNLNKGKFTCDSSNKTNNGIKTVTPFYSYTGNYTLACGSFDGSILLYDIHNLSKEYYKIKKHNKLINKIDCKSYKNNNIIVTASRDGSVKIFDIRTYQDVVSLEPPKNSAYIPDCWCVATGNNYIEENSCGIGEENFNICAGYDNGDIKFFDLKMMNLEHEVNVNNGVCSISYDRKETKKNKLICSTLEGNIYLFNLDVYSEDAGYSYRKDKIISGTCWGTPFLPQNRDIFALLGGDGNLILYKYIYPEKNHVFDETKGCKRGIIGELDKLNYLNISTQPIISFDWNRQKLGLCALASLDQTIKVYIITKLNLY